MTQPTAPEITKMIRTTNGYEINVVKPVETVDFIRTPPSTQLRLTNASSDTWPSMTIGRPSLTAL
jgi:hypothetical protein